MFADFQITLAASFISLSKTSSLKGRIDFRIGIISLLLITDSKSRFLKLSLISSAEMNLFLSAMMHKHRSCLGVVSL